MWPGAFPNLVVEGPFSIHRTILTENALSARTFGADAKTTRRNFLKTIPTFGTAFAVSGNILLDDAGALAQEAPVLEGHFHSKGKAPSAHAQAILDEDRATVPFSDTEHLDERKRVLIAEMPKKQIMADAGHVAWDKARFVGLEPVEEFDNIHPSLRRMSRLDQNNGH